VELLPALCGNRAVPSYVRKPVPVAVRAAPPVGRPADGVMLSEGARDICVGDVQAGT
jgi:hypothetical protein